MTAMNGIAVSRRMLLKGSGAAAALAITGGRAEAIAGPDDTPDCLLNVLYDYSRWALTQASDSRGHKAEASPSELVVTDIAPSLIGGSTKHAIIRPAALATLPVSTLVALFSGPRAIVLDAASAAPGAATEPVSWQRLAEVMAAPGMPIQIAVLDLGGRTIDDEAVRAGAAIFERTFAKLRRGKWAAVSIHQGPRRTAS